MTFTRKKSSTPEAKMKPKKVHVVSVRLSDELYQTVLQNCSSAGRKLSDFWRRALLNSKVVAIATPEDMAILRQIGSMSNNLNQLATIANQTKDLKLVSWEVKARAEELRILYKKLSHDWRHH